MRVLLVLGLAACWTSPVRDSVVVTAPSKPVARCLREQPLPVTHWLEAEMTAQVLRVCSVRLSNQSDDESQPDRACVAVTEAGVVVAAPSWPPSPLMDGGTALSIDGRAFACANNGRCQALGPKLAAVVGELEYAKVSDDGALVTSDKAESVWNVVEDRPLVFEDRADIPESYTHARFDFVGALVEASWTPCAGPCTVSQILKRDGTPIADDISTVTGVLALSGDRLAVMRDGLAIYDANRATLVKTIAVVPRGFVRVLSQLPAGDGGDPDPMELFPDGRLAVVTRSKTAVEIAFVDLERGVVAKRVNVPVCTP